MAKQVYVPMVDEVFDVWGVSICECGRAKFVVWRGGEIGFDEFHIDECVPYEGELVPRVNIETKDIADRDMRLKMPWKTREVKDAERERIKQDEAFKRGMDEVAKSREQIVALKKTLEAAVPGVTVRSVGTGFGEEARQAVEVRMDITDPDVFYGRSTGLGKRMAEKIAADAERRSKEGTRAGMLDPRGEGSIEDGMGTERR